MKLESIEPIQTLCRCRPGTQINACMREAVILAMQEGHLIKFIFNGKEYIADPEIIARNVCEVKDNPKCNES